MTYDPTLAALVWSLGETGGEIESRLRFPAASRHEEGGIANVTGAVPHVRPRVHSTTPPRA